MVQELNYQIQGVDILLRLRVIRDYSLFSVSFWLLCPSWPRFWRFGNSLLCSLYVVVLAEAAVAAFLQGFAIIIGTYLCTTSAFTEMGHQGLTHFAPIFSFVMLTDPTAAAVLQVLRQL